MDVGVPPLPWFLAVVGTMLVGQLVHRAVDRSPSRGADWRRRELGVLWIVVGGGFWTLLDGLLYLTVSSQLQWEVAWSDVALGVLLMGCALPRHRGGWMDAAVLALLILFLSDAAANLWQVFRLGSATPVHFWSACLELLQCTLAVLYLRAYRRYRPTVPTRTHPFDAKETT